MSDRDPRIDPQVGDIVYGGDALTVEARDGDKITWSCKGGLREECTLHAWRGWAKYAEVRRTA